MITRRYQWFALIMMIGSISTLRADLITIDFSDKSLPNNSYHNGGPDSNSLGWSSGSGSNLVYFGNSYSSDFGGYWNGFSYSNVNDTGNFNSSSKGSVDQQYSAITQHGVGGSGVYAIASAGNQAFLNLPDGFALQSVSLTNTTYAYQAIKNGDEYGFSRPLSQPGDFFKVTFTGFDQLGGVGSVTNSVDFFLSQGGATVDVWQQLNLTSLANAKSVRLSFDSSDTSVFSGVTYINTPSYVALDNLMLRSISAVPEPSGFVLTALAMLYLAGFRTRICE